MQPDSKRICETFEAQGVVRVRGLYDGDQLGAIHSALARYERDILPGLPEADVVYEADGKAIRNLWRMDHHDPFFTDLAREPKLRELIGRLVHGAAVSMGVETFNKPAKVGSGVPPHQDNAYFCLLPADVLTVWVALDAVTEDNGPVFYVPGSHKLGMLPHKPSGVKGNSRGLARPFDKSDVFAGTLQPGDALIHHGQSIHYSGPNRTDHPRRGLLMVFRGEHAKPDPALKAAYAAGGAATS